MRSRLYILLDYYLVGTVERYRGSTYVFDVVGAHLLFRIAFSLPSKYNCRFSIQLMAHDHFLLRGVGNTQTYNTITTV